MYEPKCFSLEIKQITLDVVIEKTPQGIEYNKTNFFGVEFYDGAKSYGTIKNKTAKIVGIYAPSIEDNVVHGTHTYERVLSVLNSMNIKSVSIFTQSYDSIYVLKKLVDKNILINPRKYINPDYTGLTKNEHPTLFDINTDVLLKNMIIFIR